MNPNVPIRRYLAAVERHINGKVERALPTPESCPEDRKGVPSCSPNVAIIRHVFLFVLEGVAPCFKLLVLLTKVLGSRDIVCIEFCYFCIYHLFAF